MSYAPIPSFRVSSALAASGTTKILRSRQEPFVQVASYTHTYRLLSQSRGVPELGLFAIQIHIKAGMNGGNLLRAWSLTSSHVTCGTTSGGLRSIAGYWKRLEVEGRKAVRNRADETQTT